MQGPVFSKDFPHYIEKHWTDEFLNRFTHTFLIRDAAKVVTSVQRRWPDVHLKELAFVEQRVLFDRIADRDGQAPPVIDSDNLLENPECLVRAYCDAVGLPFIKEALTWEAGVDTGSYSWYDGGSWHEKLKGSTGLNRKSQVTRIFLVRRTTLNSCTKKYSHTMTTFISIV